MNNYSGKVCPFCKTEFQPNDEIVVCSACDMPHHKDCWVENQGCTTFGCLGTIKSAGNTATSVTLQHMDYEDLPSGNSENHVYCTRCGAQNAATSFFCSRCGNRLTTPDPVSQAPVYSQSNAVNQSPYAYGNPYYTAYQQQGGYASAGYGSHQSAGIDGDLPQLIGVKTEYYLPRFQKMKAQNKQTSWNWAAFLVAPYWMIYRKMYGYGAGFLAAVFLISQLNSAFLSFISLAGYIAIGILGNSIYMKYLEGKASQARTMNEPFRSQFLAQSSGVNTTATILTIVGYALLTAIVLA